MLQYEESGWVGGCSSILMCKPMGILKIIYNALKLFRPRHFCWILTSPEYTIGLECIFYSPNNLFPKGSFCTLGARYIIIMIIMQTFIQDILHTYTCTYVHTVVNNSSMTHKVLMLPNSSDH